MFSLRVSFGRTRGSELTKLNLISTSLLGSLLVRRNYAIIHKVNPSVFDEGIPRNTALKLLKHELWFVSNHKKLQTLDPRLDNLVNILSSHRFPTNIDKRKMVKELYTLIIQNRINDDELYKAIQSALRSAKIVNVNVPKAEVVSAHDNRQKQNNHIPTDIKPQGNSKLDNILQQFLEVKDSNFNELYQLVSNLIEESSEYQKFSANAEKKVGISNEIDITTLEDYLHKVSTKQKQKKEVLKKKKKVYDWNHSVEKLQNYSGGHLLFQGIESNNVFRNKSWRDITNSLPSLLKPKAAPSNEFLFLNLRDNSESIKNLNSSNRILFNLQKSDLFGMISNSSYTPDEIINRLNILKVQNWKLLGRLYESPEILVLEKRTTMNKSYRSTYLLVITSIGIISLIIFFNSSRKEDKNDIENRTKKS